MYKGKKLLALFLLSGALFLAANFVYALEIREYPTILGMSVDSGSSLPEYAKYFFNIGIFIAITLASLAIVLGGIYWLVDFGRGKFSSEGREWLKSGILGMLIILGSYMIAYTINPDLVIFKLNELLPAGWLAQNQSGFPPGAKVEIYQEIPLGVLAEKTLTKTEACYNFDPEGNPIPGENVETDNHETVKAPTYLEYDRVKCILNLASAVEKKSAVISNLSEEITKLMQKCSCSGKCSETCDTKINPQTGEPQGCHAVGNQCVGNCVKAPCKPKANTDCCPQGIKDKIEHGPVEVKLGDVSEGDDCEPQTKEYAGLDELKTDKQNISQDIEKKVQINKKDVTIIDTDKFKSLKLVEQLMYLKEKLSTVSSGIEDDVKKLDSAKAALQNCYLAKPYIDFVKIDQQAKKEDKVVLAQKPFADSPANSEGKYCKGFNYANSSCLKKCNNACPDSSVQVMRCYKACEQCKPDDKDCLQRQKKCVSDCYMQRPCIFSNAYSDFKGCISSCRGECAQECAKTYSACSDEFKTCQAQCGLNSQCVIDNFDKCLINSQDIQACSQTSENDPGNAKNCADKSYLCKYGSNENAGYAECLKSPYSASGDYSSLSFVYDCPNCQVCPQPYKTCPNCKPPQKSACLELNPKTAKCPSASSCPQCPCGIAGFKFDVELDVSINRIVQNPDIKIKVGNPFGLGDANGGNNAGINLPILPGQGAGQNQEIIMRGGSPFNFEVGNDVNVVNFPNFTEQNSANYVPGGGGFNLDNPPPANPDGGDGGGDDGGIPITRITDQQTLVFAAKRIIGGECSEYGYNDDPLTFYCKQDWKNDPAEKPQEPLGKERVCPLDNEIPVGQAVDNTELWAASLVKAVNEVKQGAQDMLTYLKKVSQAQNYCNCDSKYDNGQPICTSDCKFNPAVPNDDPDKAVPAKCSLVTCKGNPCKQIIDLLAKIPEKHQQARASFINFYTSVIFDSRTDVLKQLTYSRQKMNSCSSEQNNYEKDVKLLSCERAEDNILSPVVNATSKTIIGNKTEQAHCYGKNLERTGIGGLANNWFCCELREKQ